MKRGNENQARQCWGERSEWGRRVACLPYLVPPDETASESPVVPNDRKSFMKYIRTVEKDPDSEECLIVKERTGDVLIH